MYSILVGGVSTAGRWLSYYRTWLTLPWLVLLVAAFFSQFWIGYTYNSNETTNIFLQIARGCSYTLLLAICLLWLPVMRHGLAALWRSQWTAWLPLDHAKNIHRWLGHLLMAAALIHGGAYLLYFNTLEEPFLDVLFGTESDVVRSMKTTMYEFVSEDESIDDVADWVNNGMPRDDFDTVIQPLMKEDCSKCHSRTSTMTYAIPTLPLSHYEDVVALSQQGIYSRQFRINVCGIVMFLLFVPLWFSSLAFMRRRHHHLFQHIHRLGYLLAVLALLHIPRYEWLVVPTIILSIEFLLSHYVRFYRGQLARIDKVNDSILRLEMKRPEGFSINSGHYLQLRIPSIKRYEWHDFSLTGEREHDDVIVLKIKALGDWTDKLYEAMGDKDDINLVVDIRGPFASPAAKKIKEDEWLMIAGGIGITPFLGFMHSMLFHPDKIKKFHLVWVLRDSKLLEWLEPFITSPIVSGGRMHFYFTQSGEYEGDKDVAQLPEWLNNSRYVDRVGVHNTRPHWESLFDSISEELTKPHCFVCGPDGMTKSVSALCREKGWPVSVEKF